MATSGSSMMYASMGISAISAVSGAFEQAAAYRAQGDYESTIARTNAAIAELQAKETLEAGDLAASRKNLQTRQVVGALRASQAGSGTDVASGSNALVRNSVAGVGAIDELTIRNNAARQAWGFKTQAMQDSFQGEFAQLTAKSRADQTLLTGGLTAIEGPMAIEANYLRWSRYMGGGESPTAKPFPTVN